MHIHKIESVAVCLEDVRERLGITQNDDNTRDAVLESRILAAQELLESDCNTVFTKRTVTTYAERGSEKVHLLRPYGGLVNAQILEYKNTSGVYVPYVGTDDELDDLRGCYYFGTAPSDLTDKRNAYRLTYYAGYDTAPETLREALLVILFFWERQQVAVANGARPMTLPNAALQLCIGYRDFRQSF